MKRLLILPLILLACMVGAQPSLKTLPETWNGYVLESFSGEVSPQDAGYTAYQFVYRKESSDRKMDAVYVNFRIYTNAALYREQVENFTFEDAYTTMGTMNLNDLADEQALMKNLTEAFVNGGEESEEVSEKEALAGIGMKELDDPSFTSGQYRLADGPSGNDFFRAVVTWGNDRYAEITSSAGDGEKLSEQELLDFIREFPLEKL